MATSRKVTLTFDGEWHALLSKLAREDQRSLANYLEQLIVVTINSGCDLKAQMNPALHAGLLAYQNGKTRAH
jgi:hypothetical protein